MIVTFETVNQLYGDLQPHLVTSIESNKNNVFAGKPEGVIISDTYNNLIFPMDFPEVDSGKGALGLILNQFKTNYSKDLRIPMLPWHYFLEFSSIGNYVAYNTKPINMTFPFNSRQCNDIIRANNLKSDFFNNNEVQNYIHVVIAGNSNRDVYTKFLYELIGRYIILPLSKVYKFSPNSGVIALNMGNKFKLSLLDFYAR